MNVLIKVEKESMHLIRPFFEDVLSLIRRRVTHVRSTNERPSSDRRLKSRSQRWKKKGERKERKKERESSFFVDRADIYYILLLLRCYKARQK